MKKPIFAWLVVMVLLLVSLQGCTEGESGLTTEHETTVPEVGTTEAPTESNTEAPTESNTEAPTESETEGSTAAEAHTFSYRLTETAVSKGDRVCITVTVTNASSAVYTYTGSSSGYRPRAVLYCTLNGERYILQCEPIPENDDIGTFEIQPGGSRSVNLYYPIPDAAPSGSYTLELSYGDFCEVFPDVLTVSE